jgi:hypothetical protein
MITIEQIREKYPQYENKTNQELADSLYNKHYSNKMDKNEFYSKVGIENQDPQDGSTFHKITNKIVTNPLMQPVYGAGDAFINAVSFGGVKKGRAQEMGMANPNSLLYNLGKIPGNIAAAAIPAGLASKAIGAGALGASSIPYANLLGDIAGGAEWGFAANPGDRKKQALLGGLLGGIGGAIPFMRPGKTYKTLKEMFSEGNMLERTASGNDLYKEAIGKLEKSPFTTSTNYSKEFAKDELSYAATRPVKKGFEKLEKNSVIEKAIELKKDVNKELHRDLFPKEESSIKGLNSLELKRIELYKTLNDSLGKDIAGSLKIIDPKSGLQYTKADVNWAKNVAPYQTTERLLKHLERKFYTRESTQAAKEILKSPFKHAPEAIEAAQKILRQRKMLNSVIAGGFLGEELLSGGAGIKKLKHLILGGI